MELLRQCISPYNDSLRIAFMNLKNPYLTLLKFIMILIVAAPTEGSWQFCRLKHEGRWSSDHPDAELKLIAMLEDITFIDATPEPIVVSTNEQDLSQCAFVVASNIDSLLWSEDEAKAIGDWLRKGGFLWTDGIWNDEAWEHWNLQLQRALPKAYVHELQYHHPIFKYPFKVFPQQPCPQGGRVMNFAVADNKGRLMVLMTFNQRRHGNQCGFVGDAWEGFAENWQNEQASWSFSVNVFLNIMTHSSICDDASNGGVRYECLLNPF